VYSPVDLLIVAAYAPELDPLRELLGDGLSGTIRGVRVMARPVGIGLALAAAGVSYRVATRRPRGVVMVGSCGAYPDRGRAVGEVTVARAVRLVDPAEVTGDAAYPQAMSVVEETDRAMSEGLVSHGGVPARVATTLAVTTSARVAGEIARRTDSDVEHLEAFAAAAACAKERTPFAVVLGIADVVGTGTRVEWRAHGRAAHDAAGRVVAAWLRAQAPGLWLS
jgi:nucleoside phosphorylase